MKRNLLIMVVVLLNVYLGAQDIQTGLIASYSFCGDVLDESNFENHGTFMGQSLPVFGEDRLGNENSAMFFNGINDYISVPPSESMNSPEGEATVACWFKYLSLAYGQWGVLCAKSDQNAVISREYSLGFNNLGQIYWHTTYVGETTLETDVWYHVAVTYTPEILKCYLNGELIGEVIPNDPLSTNELPFEIGRDTPVAIEYFHGYIDEMQIFNRALTYEDIIALSDYSACETQSINEEFSNIIMTVYPIPVTSTLHVNLPETFGSYKFELYDAMGQQILQTEASNPSFELNMDRYKTGLYFIVLTKENLILSERVMKN